MFFIEIMGIVSFKLIALLVENISGSTMFCSGFNAKNLALWCVAGNNFM